jgi:hypothetical protein
MLATLLVAALAGAVSAPAARAAVVLNEIECETDWVELVNTSDEAVDISGWLLTDDPLTQSPPRANHRMLFPNPTVIPSHGVLVVDKGTVSGTFPFGISCNDDTIRLADGTETLVDEIALHPLTPPSDTLGRYPNGAGPWVQTLPTKSAPNEPSSAGGGPPADQAAWLFDPGKVVEINLTLPQSSIDALGATPTEYVDGTFSLNTTGGTYGPLNVGVRLKGGVGSFRTLAQKAAFKVKFNHSVSGQRFLGLKKLTLNNMVQDRSMIHEVLAYDLFRAVGVAAPRTGYAYVRVNGDDYGLYLDLETLDDVSLPTWFGSTQHLYEGEYSVDVKPGDAGAYQVDEGSSTDRADLEALIAAANAGGGDWSDGVAGLADLAQMTRMWAVEKYIGHWDGYSGDDDPNHQLPNNYYLHSDAGGQFTMLPWGTDQTWDAHLAFDGEASGVMFDKCLADAGCLAMYRDALRAVGTSIAGLDLDSRAVSTAAVLAPSQQIDPRREYSTNDIAAAVSSTRAFLAARPGEADAWLDSTSETGSPLPEGPPAAPSDPPLSPPSPSPPSPPPTTPVRALSLTPPKVAGGVLTTRLDLPVPGRLSQRATTRVGKVILTVCRAWATRTQSGVATMRCRLSSAAKRLLRSRPLKLTVKIWFRPVGGRLTAITRTLTAKRQPA